MYVQAFIYFLGKRPVLWMLLIVNVLGTLYGYYWYRYQLEETPIQFLLFVPDSPTASLFFVIVLVGFLQKKHYGLFEALAFVSLVKYGLWAVGMNIFLGIKLGGLDIMSIMLIFSHLAMAIEAVLYAPYYRIKGWHLAVSGIVILHNEIIDYVFQMMPRYSILNEYMPQIGYVTFWLSMVTIFIAYRMMLHKKRMVAELP